MVKSILLQTRPQINIYTPSIQLITIYILRKYFKKDQCLVSVIKRKL